MLTWRKVSASSKWQAVLEMHTFIVLTSKHHFKQWRSKANIKPFRVYYGTGEGRGQPPWDSAGAWGKYQQPVTIVAQAITRRRTMFSSLLLLCLRPQVNSICSGIGHISFTIHKAKRNDTGAGVTPLWDFLMAASADFCDR